MRVSGLSQTRVRARLQSWRRVGVALLGAVILWAGSGADALQAQQWRGRISSRVQYVEGRALVLDSVPVGLAAGSGAQRQVGDTLVTCSAGQSFCYFYRPGEELSTYPSVLDLDLNIFGFGVQGLRAFVSTRFRSDFGGDRFWPRTEDNFDLIAGYVELQRPAWRLRLGRDYQISGLGLYGYDGGSILVRIRPAFIELEAYGGWGLARGLPERVTSSALESLGVFQPVNDNYLFGFRGSARPVRNSSIEAIYQREIEMDRSGISSERLSFAATYAPTSQWTLEGHADYDLAAGWWGKAGAKVGWYPITKVYLEGRLFRYRPVFSLQTIWLAFSPTPYSGYGLALGLRPGYNLTIRLEGERRDYSDTGAETAFAVPTTDHTWRAGVWGQWKPKVAWDVEGGYWLNWGFGAGVSSGDLRLNWHPTRAITLGGRFSAFDQRWEFRIGDAFTWSLGGDVRWRTRAGTLWAGLSNYWYDRKADAAQTDWSQLRAVLGFTYYVGSEPGRSP